MDSIVRLNPMRALFHIKNDKEWRALSTKDIHPKPSWIQPDMPMPEDASEEITARRIFQRAANSTMKPWGDKGLRQLRVLADSG